MAKAKILALVGKGGTGKTVLSALIARQLVAAGQKRILLIDADPAMGLALALGAGTTRTTGDIRREIIQNAHKQQKNQLAGTLDYLLLEALQERDSYSLLVMGRMDTQGCYCPVNALLREAIDDLAQNFDYILIDGEAGIEQINRQVIKRVDVLAIVSDASLRGIHTAKLIGEISGKIKGMEPERIGVIFNRVSQIASTHEQEIKNANLEVFGWVPTDSLVADFDARGRSLFELPDNTPAIQAIQPILEDILSLI